MPSALPVKDIEAAEAAVAFAQQVRKYHRRRTATTSAQRAQEIETALQRLKDAMRPLKSEIGKFALGPQTNAAERNRERIREASAAIQRERRKLWKMKREPKGGT